MSLNEKIDNLSALAVSKYADDGVPLNETISKIAESEHFNENHIARLVEMSNRKTFLRVYPEKHSFDVASVPAVMTLLNRQKAAAVCKSEIRNPKSEILTGLGADGTNYKLLTLFKPGGNQKEALDSNPKSEIRISKSDILTRSQTKRAIEELKFTARQKCAEMLGCEDKLVDITKQAILRGSTFADLETHTLSTLKKKKKEASEVLGRVYNRVKRIPFVEKRASERGCRVEPFVGESNLYTDMVEAIVKNAHVIPCIERSIKILETKLGTR